MDLARHVILGAVQGDQHVAAKLAASLQPPLQFGHHLGEDRMKVIGTDRVQQRPDMIVAGDPVEAEQRLAIRPPLSLLQTALVRQERRAFRKNRENADRSAIVSAHHLPAAGPAARGAPQPPEETIQDFHALRNHFSGAEEIPQKRSSTFSIKLSRSTGSWATQCQSDLTTGGQPGTSDSCTLGPDTGWPYSRDR